MKTDKSVKKIQSDMMCRKYSILLNYWFICDMNTYDKRNNGGYPHKRKTNRNPQYRYSRND